jgi:hypothetical protein
MPKKLLATASLIGTLLLTGGKPTGLKLPPALVTSQELKELLTQILAKLLPKNQRLLTDDEEERISETISQSLGLKASFTLEGNRLNNQWGLMGLEQHLARFPGDTLQGRAFAQAGIAPNRGAFGYFASAEQEKYYVAVQTLYLPDWNTKAKTLKDWYKFRKVLVINPATGAVVVAVIGDAGPAKFTGRQFGGSPQVMHDLGFYPKTHEGRVLLMFVDDPEGKIPLGPITQPLNRPEPKLV